MKEYLKRYQSNHEEEEKKKKKKKKIKAKPDALGVLVVDEDPVWQKSVNIQEEEEENDSADEEKPVVDEDIEVKRMKRLELLRARRPYNAIAEDGSGWVSLPLKNLNSDDPIDDMSPPRRGRTRNDTPSPEHDARTGKDKDLSPPRERQRQQHTDLSPPRKPQSNRILGEPEVNASGVDVDLYPPRRQRARNDIPSSRHDVKPSREDSDLSPPRPLRIRQGTSPSDSGSDLSPPRKSRDVQKSRSPNLSPQRKRQSTQTILAHESMAQDLSPPRKNRKELNNPPLARQPKTGLITGRDMQDEFIKTKQNDLMRFEQMDPSMSGRGAEPVYRDKKTGQRISKEEFLKPKEKIQEKPKEKKIEWGQGLAQKREAEARLQELELEKDRPFARSRDDPELDKILKERVRWGDPMAHLVKKKHSELALPDLGNNEKMKESGFIIPQGIPSHSWIKRGIDAAPNRYGISPGRHWDGVDRSNGFEKQMFKRMNEKQATEREAYLWSVSDM